MQTRSFGSPLLALVALVAFAGCGDSDSDSTAAANTPTHTQTPTPSPSPTATTPSFPLTPRAQFGGDRPVTIQVPTTYNASQPAPLLVVLHGYGANGVVQQQYLGVSALVESDGVLIIAPDGTLDSGGSRFWNATPACCDFARTNVDDVGYIRGLISEIRKDYNVDHRRIYLIGHSNGGFMAHRLACEAAGEIAAIVSLAAATFKDAAACTPAEPVSTLNVHGDMDTTIRYAGGQSGAPYPGALETMMHWQVYNQCTPGLVTDPARLNLDFSVPGVETEVQRFNNCARGSGVELWTIKGGGHIPSLLRTFSTNVWKWLSEHPKQ